MGTYLNKMAQLSEKYPMKGSITIIGISRTKDDDYLYQCRIGLFSMFQIQFCTPADIRYIDVLISTKDSSTLVKIKEEYNKLLIEYSDFDPSKSLSYLDLEVIKNKILEFHNNTVLQSQDFCFLATPIDTSHGGIHEVFLRDNFTISCQEYWDLINGRVFSYCI